MLHNFTWIISHNPHSSPMKQVFCMIQIWKLRFREVTSSAQSHTAGMWWNQDTGFSSLTPEPAHISEALLPSAGSGVGGSS